MDYQTKYIKYKTKYCELKNKYMNVKQFGGGDITVFNKHDHTSYKFNYDPSMNTVMDIKNQLAKELDSTSDKLLLYEMDNDKPLPESTKIEDDYNLVFDKEPAEDLGASMRDIFKNLQLAANNEAQPPLRSSKEAQPPLSSSVSPVHSESPHVITEHMRQWTDSHQKIIQEFNQNQKKYTYLNSLYIFKGVNIGRGCELMTRESYNVSVMFVLPSHLLPPIVSNTGDPDCIICVTFTCQNHTVKSVIKWNIIGSQGKRTFRPELQQFMDLNSDTIIWLAYPAITKHLTIYPGVMLSIVHKWPTHTKSVTSTLI